MRRTARSVQLALAMSAAALAGCTGPLESGRTESANTTSSNTTNAPLGESTELEFSQGNPASGKFGADNPRKGNPKGAAAIPFASGAPDDFRLDPTDDPRATSDSDAPRVDRRPVAGATGHSAAEHTHAADDPETPKRNGRQPDGDDPAAPLIVPDVSKKQDDAPLNNGRAPSAQPIPAAQRVAAEASAEPTPLDQGRGPNAKPGAEVAGAVPAKPAAKPAGPQPATLADLSESVQALDKDGDGQLGLYEWPREKIAEFKTLDANQDGFLTPTELVDAAKNAQDSTTPETKAPKTTAPKTTAPETAAPPKTTTPETDKSPAEDAAEGDKEPEAKEPEDDEPVSQEAETEKEEDATRP